MDDVYSSCYDSYILLVATLTVPALLGLIPVCGMVVSAYLCGRNRMFVMINNRCPIYCLLLW